MESLLTRVERLEERLQGPEWFWWQNGCYTDLKSYLEDADIEIPTNQEFIKYTDSGDCLPCDSHQQNEIRLSLANLAKDLADRFQTSVDNLHASFYADDTDKDVIAIRHYNREDTRLLRGESSPLRNKDGNTLEDWHIMFWWYCTVLFNTLRRNEEYRREHYAGWKESHPELKDKYFARN